MPTRKRSTPKSAAPDPEPPFEASLERLEAIVDELESGELALEDSLVRFEEGVTLSRQCANQLAAARQRIDVLMSENGEPVERPFAGGADDAEDPD